MAFFKTAVQVQDKDKDQENKIYYISLNKITKGLFGDQVLTYKNKTLIHRRILEIIHPDTRVAACSDRIKELFFRIHHLQKNFTSAKDIVTSLEILKQDMSITPKIYYNKSLLEFKDVLKPGDILVRKYHEDHPNIICTCQNLFKTKGYREAYKCSHLALYVGEMQGCAWIAEASIPEGKDIQVRRIKLDDSRFLPKNKNEYLLFRRKDQSLAQESARLAKNYAVKMLPKKERKPTALDQKKTLRFNSIEAIRSLWHSSKLQTLGLYRNLKCYSDYHNKIPFEYLGKKRKFFCSHFVITMQSLAEMKKSAALQSLLKKHPPPKKYNEKLKGSSLKIAKLWYSIKKEFWALGLAIRHKKELKNSFKNQLDALRSAPHKVVNYMLNNKDQFEFIGTILKRGDLAFGK